MRKSNGFTHCRRADRMRHALYATDVLLYIQLTSDIIFALALLRPWRVQTTQSGQRAGKSIRVDQPGIQLASHTWSACHEHTVISHKIWYRLCTNFVTFQTRASVHINNYQT